MVLTPTKIYLRIYFDQEINLFKLCTLLREENLNKNIITGVHFGSSSWGTPLDKFSCEGNKGKIPFNKKDPLWKDPLWIIYKGRKLLPIYIVGMKCPFGYEIAYEILNELKPYLGTSFTIKEHHITYKYKINPPFDAQKHTIKTEFSTFSITKTGHVFQHSSSQLHGQEDYMRFVHP